jgi:multidrug efflux pump subunit AcrA (membrane-fusion protein)
MRTLILLSLVVMLLSGCTSNQVAAPGMGEAPETTGLYQKGKGLLLPEEMKSNFGLQMVEVTERPMASYCIAIAQVYRAAQEDKPGAATLLVSSEVAKDLKVGQTVQLQLQRGTGANKAFSGKLLRLDGKSEAFLGQTEALVEFTDPENVVESGGMLTATFKIREAKPVIAVPESALLSCSEGPFVYVVNGKHLTRTSIKAGTQSEGWVEVMDGLYTGDAVVVKGLDDLWFIELSALKGGAPCCPVPKK